jgi:hypothetical protein
MDKIVRSFCMEGYGEARVARDAFSIPDTERETLETHYLSTSRSMLKDREVLKFIF